MARRFSVGCYYERDEYNQSPDWQKHFLSLFFSYMFGPEPFFFLFTNSLAMEPALIVIYNKLTRMNRPAMESSSYLFESVEMYV